MLVFNKNKINRDTNSLAVGDLLTVRGAWFLIRDIRDCEVELIKLADGCTETVSAVSLTPTYGYDLVLYGKKLIIGRNWFPQSMYHLEIVGRE